MATLKVTVNKLNLRSSPVKDFANKENVVGVLHKDAVFESVGVIENELGKWHVGKDGHCVSDKWVGAAISQLGLPEIDFNQFVAAYNFDWFKTNGAGTTIGLIDTGITVSTSYYNNPTEEILSNSNRDLHHGNFIAGILCGKKIVQGIAKDIILYSIKYKSDSEDISIQLTNFIQALTRMLNVDGPLIVNISQGFNAQTIKDKFQNQGQQIIDLIKQISAQKRKLIICAAGDNSAINDVLFPANENECVSVGCIDEFSTDLLIKVKLDILTPMVVCTSFDNAFNKVKDSGSSFSTAMISALAACFLAKYRSIAKQNFLEELKRFSIQKSSFNYGAIKLFQYQIIQ